MTCRTPVRNPPVLPPIDDSLAIHRGRLYTLPSYYLYRYELRVHTPRYREAALWSPPPYPRLRTNLLSFATFRTLRIQIMEPPPVILSPVKDGRRVLGEKTTNASMSPTRRQRNVDSAVTADIPLKPLHESPSPRKIILPRCHAGQKRTIDEVEDTNNPEPRTRLFAGLKQQREEGCEIHNKNTQSTVDSEDQVRGQLLNKAQGSICTDVGHCYRT